MSILTQDSKKLGLTTLVLRIGLCEVFMIHLLRYSPSWCALLLGSLAWGVMLPVSATGIQEREMSPSLSGSSVQEDVSQENVFAFSGISRLNQEVLDNKEQFLAFAAGDELSINPMKAFNLSESETERLSTLQEAEIFPHQTLWENLTPDGPVSSSSQMSPMPTVAPLEIPSLISSSLRERTAESLPPLTISEGEAEDLTPAPQVLETAQVQSGEMVTPDSETVSPAVETTETNDAVKVVTEDEVTTNPYFDRANTFYATFYGIPLQGRDSAQDFIGRATFDLGYGLGGAIGYRFNNNLRGEIEYSYFDNGFQDLFFFVPGTTTVAPNQPEQSPGATVTGRAIMVNAYYDFPVSEQFRPYIGAGIGTYNARINSLSPPGFGGFVANGDSADRFAFQLRAGISYLFTPHFEVFTGYRYFKGQEFEYIIANTGTPPLVLRPNGLESNSWEIGLRYNF